MPIKTTCANCPSECWERPLPLTHVTTGEGGRFVQSWLELCLLHSEGSAHWDMFIFLFVAGFYVANQELILLLKSY